MGPILGSIVAAGFYKFIKVLEYETANPSQDADKDIMRRAEEHDLSPPGTGNGRRSHTYGDFADSNEQKSIESLPQVPAATRTVAGPDRASTSDHVVRRQQDDGLVRRLDRGASYTA